jgi:SAM-dependent methyltransferase
MPAASEPPGRALIDRYDREAPDYRDLWAPTLRIAGRRLLRELAGRPADRVLDVATGVGALLPDLRAAFPSACILGVDRSRGMLALVPREFPTAVMDATRLGIAPRSMDLVLLAFVLFHLEEPAAALREARRALRAGGRVACITWAGDLESPACRLWTECLDAHGAPASDPAVTARHDAVDSPSKMEALLGDAGFSGARCWGEDLVDRIGPQRLVELKTRLGSAKPRFDGLAPRSREACLAAARRGLECLGPDDFLARGGVVYSIADNLQ